MMAAMHTPCSPSSPLSSYHYYYYYYYYSVEDYIDSAHRLAHDKEWNRRVREEILSSHKDIYR